MVMYESIIFTYNQSVFMGLHHANCTLYITLFIVSNVDNRCPPISV